MSKSLAIAELAYRAIPKSERKGRTAPINQGGVNATIPSDIISLSTAELRALAGTAADGITTAFEARVAASKAKHASTTPVEGNSRQRREARRAAEAAATVQTATVRNTGLTLAQAVKLCQDRKLPVPNHFRALNSGRMAAFEKIAAKHA